MTFMTNLLISAVFATGIALGAHGDVLIAASVRAQDLASCYQSYPNIPGRVVAENDKMVVQRFSFPPGQWEGVHAHPPNQLYIMLTGTTWKVRFGDKTSSGYSPAGSVGFYGPVNLSEDHESVNIGDTTADLIWVTLKEGCAT